MHSKMSFFTMSSVDYYDTSALSTKLLVCLMALSVLVSATGALLELYARWSWRNFPLRQHGSSFVDVEDALDEPAQSLQTVGLSKWCLNSLPTFVFSKNMTVEAVECSVCLCEFQENEKGRLLPKCNHRFHTGCIDMWFHTHSTCPLCRACVGVEESLYFSPYLDEEVGVSESSTSSAGNDTSLSNTTSESALVDQSSFLKAYALDKHRTAAFLQQQGFAWWQQQPAAALASSRKSVQLPVNVLFCGKDTQMTSHVSSNSSSAIKVGHLDLAMDLPHICPSPSPSTSWTSTPSVHPPGAKNSPLYHLNAIKRMLNTQDHRFGSAPVSSNYADCKQGIEAV